MNDLDYPKLDNEAYKKAREFLLENTPNDITNEIIESYLIPPNAKNENYKINDLFFRLLESAQNANMKRGVISGTMDNGLNALKGVLFNFSPKKIIEKYQDDSKSLLSEIFAKVEIRGEKRDTDKSIWPKYCKTILSAAVFMNQFNNTDDFYDWIEFFYKDQKSIAALPLIMASEIYGIGFPLACDFLKEIGNDKYGKPDIHIKQIFQHIGLVNEKPSDYQTLKAIKRIADNVNNSAYNVDKVFWLIGSGYYYNHKHLGNQGRFGSLKKNFIEYWDKMN